MPPRSKVFTLPPEVLAELDRRLIDSGFGGYRDLAGWLAEQGYQIQKSALQRYGSGLEADFERTMADVQRTQRLAQAYAEANPDEANAMTGATVRIAQESLLRITLALRQAEEDPAALARSMPNVTRALADLGRLDISREKWAAEQGAKAAEALAERVAGEPGGQATPERLRAIAREIYGV
jgi:hypothetical protein